MTKKKQDPLEAEVVAAESQSLMPMPSMNIETLMEKALTSNAGMETIERLVALSERMRAQWAKQRFQQALAKFQKECPPITKTRPVFKKNATPQERKAFHDNGDMTGVQYTYAPLEDILAVATPHLGANGFSYSFKSEIDTKEMQLKAVCILHHVDGHSEPTDFVVPIGSEYMSKQQQSGAAMSFAKRYAFLNATGLQPVGEDNDAQDIDKREDKPRRGSDQNYKKGPQSKSSRKTETKEEVTGDPGAKEKYPAIVRTSRETDRITQSNLNTMLANMRRMKIPEERFEKDFGFPLAETHKNGLNSLIDWMKATEGNA